MKANSLKLVLSMFGLLSLSSACGGSGESKGNGGEKSSDIKISINNSSTGDLIPADFSGLSVETGSVRKGNAHYDGQWLFSGKNAQTLQIFKNLGLKHLRVGGGSVDINQPEPTREDIDELFSFAKESGVKIVYSFKLLNGDIEHNVELAKYIWGRYKQYIDCFSVGNEPDWNSYHKDDPEITDYPTYRNKWKKIASAIQVAIPEAKFMGPNTGSNYPVTRAKDTNHDGVSWTVHFAKDLKTSGLLCKLAQHNYVGQDVAEQQLTPEQMIGKMLSASWNDVEYPALYNATLKPVLDEGFPYRLAESNSFSSGCDGGSNCFATALFSLDYMHWWAGHGCAGVNFHNKQWVLNGPITVDEVTHELLVNPVGYGIAAFNLSGQGTVLPIHVDKGNELNVTAYAVKNGKDVFVTLINKEYGTDAKAATVSVDLDVAVRKVKTLELISSEGKPDSRKVTLGGAVIESSGDWNGKWKSHKDELVFHVKATSALIVKISTK